jgi:hypothetical protein
VTNNIILHYKRPVAFVPTGVVTTTWILIIITCIFCITNLYCALKLRIILYSAPSSAELDLYAYVASLLVTVPLLFIDIVYLIVVCHFYKWYRRLKLLTWVTAGCVAGVGLGFIVIHQAAH